MSVESVLARVATIEQAIANPSALVGANAAVTGGTAAALAAEPPTNGSSSFAQALQNASAGYEGAASAADPAAYTAPSAAPSYPAVSSAAGPAGAAGYPPAATGAGPTGYQPAITGAGTAATAAPTTTGTAGVGTLAPAGSAGEQIVRIAESQIGQAEQPPGSNESPAIAQYRTATAGAIPGAPWCAYFASWTARQAGEPLGRSGEGLGSVGQIWSWAQSAGRAIPNGPGVTPRPGDLIVFGGEHVGIVKDVLPNGDIQTIEGNYENKVSANVRTPAEATGYVNMS